MKRAVITMLGRVLVTGTLIVGFLAVTAEVVSAATPPNYYVTTTGGSTAAFNCHNFAVAHACSLSRALSLATTGDVIHMRAGTYNAAGNDAINTLTGLSAANNGVTIKGAAGLGTILAPAAAAADCLGQPGIIDFSPVSHMSIQRLKVDFSAASGCANPVYNSAGTGDALGTLPAGHRVVVTGAPATGADLVGGSTTLVDVWMRPPSSYTGTGVLCTGSSTTCTVTNSKINGGGSPGTSGIVVSSGASATVTNNTISDNADDGILLQNVTGSSISGDTITNNAGGGIYNYQTNGVTMTGDTLTGNAGGGIINNGTTGGTEDCGVSNSTGAGVTYLNAAGGTITGCTFSNDAGGGVLLEGSSTGQTITNSVFSSDAAGGVVATGTGNQSTGTTVSNDTFSGAMGAGVELDDTGGFTIQNNTVSGLGSNGEGFILVGSDNNTVAATR